MSSNTNSNFINISQIQSLRNKFINFAHFKILKMKYLFLTFAAALLLVSCDKKASSETTLKTAYVDTSKLLDEYTEAKDIEAKYKAKSDEMGRELEAEITKFKEEAAGFQKNAESKGPVWAQQKGAELQRREQQLQYAQQAMVQQLQKESGKEMDTLVKSVKSYIKEYGKEKGYDYILGTGESATVLYAKDNYDITKEVIANLNKKYKPTEKASDTDVKADAKSEIEKLEKKHK